MAGVGNREDDESGCGVEGYEELEALELLWLKMRTRGERGSKRGH
jgi:hypothetical protein